MSYRPPRLLLALPLALLTACPFPKEVADDSTAAEEEEDYHWPSKESCKVTSERPGWMGCTQISTTEGCWEDSDGVEPDVAGCHTLHAGDEACEVCEEAVLERISEGCHDFVDPETGDVYSWLIETNPDAGVCHPHNGGKGHPDVFDCDAFCKEKTIDGSGETYGGGACEPVEALDCDGSAVDSAWCACWTEG